MNFANFHARKQRRLQGETFATVNAPDHVRTLSKIKARLIIGLSDLAIWTENEGAVPHPTEDRQYRVKVVVGIFGHRARTRYGMTIGHANSFPSGIHRVQSSIPQQKAYRGLLIPSMLPV